MKVSRWGRGLGGCCLLALSLFWGCRETPPSNFDSNLAPETVITGAPAESSSAFYRVRMYWYGSDPDGTVDHFEYSVTDSNKTPGEDDPGFSGYLTTTATDMEFLLKANQPQILGHRFYVRSVDNEGKVDPTPAWAYFIASDFNPPNVIWESAVATWTDRAGNTRTKNITSWKSSPTDTVGVGATITFSWSGFDQDPGGFITGYEYRSTRNPEFTGGTLDDRSTTVNYQVPAGSALSAYYSGNDALFVRAIDDAGARTNPDSARTYVVNFGPKTWIVDPNQPGTPVRKRVFIDKATQQVWPSGTTLADEAKSIQFYYTGFDDPRDVSLDPSNPTGIVGFSWRRLKNGGGFAYRDVESWVPYPSISEFNSSSLLTSGDYVYLIRAEDELGRNGAPETLRVSINYAPFFDWIRYVDEFGQEQELWIPPATPGQPSPVPDIVLNQQPGGGYADLEVRFYALDEHRPPPDQHPRDTNAVVEQEISTVEDYRVRLNNARDGFEDAPKDSLGLTLPSSRFLPVAPTGGTGVVRPGLNTIELTARDFSGRTSSRTVFFNVTLQ